MSIFSKPISEIGWDDLNQLLLDSTCENVRLEFKREIPNRDETLKKIASFANTFGGYIIIGAEEDGQGNLVNIDGVDLESNFKQTVIQRCFDGIYPPVVPNSIATYPAA